MRARIVPSKVDEERLNDRCYKSLLEAQLDSNAVMLIAIIRHFNLTKRKVHNVMKTFDEVRVEFDEYDRDGIFRDKIISELKQYDIDCTEMWDIEDTFNGVANEIRLRRKNMTTTEMSEARKIRESFEGFRRIIKDNESL